MRKTSQRVGEWAEKPVLWFVVRFVCFMAVFYGVMLIPTVDWLMYGYLAANAWISDALLNLLSFRTELNKTMISSADFSIVVRRGCDGIEPAALFVSAVLAFPAPWAKKAAGIVLGTLVLLLLNIVRIVSLFWIGVVARPLFAKMHLEIWPLLFILAAIALCAAWIRWVRSQA
jgi:exosortase/archaeosortase family protein